jgi:excisionase family DNA binding protein
MLRSAALEPIATTIKNTAEALGVGKTHVYELIRQGRLDKIKLGRRTLVKIDSIRRLVEGA